MRNIVIYGDGVAGGQGQDSRLALKNTFVPRYRTCQNGTNNETMYRFVFSFLMPEGILLTEKRV
ncbi:hypothetical protein D3Z45_04010 [Lachnospiraceae bacterium]|nr:hypothetical protein [Lachnospiraceae bacterium]